MKTLEELNKKKAEIEKESKDKIQTEGELLDLLFEYIELLTCFNCGEKIIEVGFGDRKVGELYLDVGSTNYPREPDVPAEIYFVCDKCAEEIDRRRKRK